jgi:hypothetical protein
VRRPPFRANRQGVRPLCQEILDALLARHRGSGRVHLNDIAEVIAGRAVTYEEIESLVDALEAEGLTVGEPLDEQDLSVMRAVIAIARRLREELGRPPRVDEIAIASGQPAHAVRRALEGGVSAGLPRGPGAR